MPRLRSTQVVSYLGYSGHQTNAVVTAAHDQSRSSSDLIELKGWDWNFTHPVLCRAFPTR
jgi:hypothetical protein